MSTKGIAATLFGAEDLRVVDVELGELQPNMVRVKFGAGGICGSDMHYFRHARTGDFVVTSPLILGHEVAGEIVGVGSNVTGLTIGERVAVNPSRWCERCVYCHEGRANLCENIYFMGSASKTPHMQGGFASVFDATAAQCVKVPAELSFQAAALAEPLAVCLHAVRRAGHVKGFSTIVFGAGPIGLLTMLALKHADAGSVTMADVAAAPLKFAEELGADQIVDLSKGEEQLAELAAATPFDIAFEISGTAAGLASAIRTVRRGGTVVQVGNLAGGTIPVPANAVMAKELDLVGTFRFGEEFFEAVELIVEGKIDVLKLVTGEYRLSEAPEAFRMALDRSRSVKVVLTA
ncbi:L-idonate 5-dehydrogenase [Phyllobacterium sp. A18/5-2]|uniref:L-idonate 5-dehydrogenase n=1 Tax=Phyllobacterium sp. A18/5-2 TaxID=2978392 RepID=UPI000DE08E8C|nr:L-idonate 5-dehydrogenase [Phyllobacterium sp. A18/5-2]UXN65679.1 L-idonate 5-dehydrogenase [Phyllobacterium sp. A18/5-2]